MSPVLILTALSLLRFEPAAAEPCGLAQALRYYAKQGQQGIISYDDEIREILANRDAEPIYREITVNHRVFRATSQIDDRLSAHDVYKGVDSDGRAVVIKDLKDLDNSWLTEYEVLATQYLQQQGVDVPTIYESDLRRTRIVKEYIEGLNFEELRSYHQGGPLERALAREAMESLPQERRRIELTFKGFEAWLQRRNPPPSRQFWKNSRLIRSLGDFKTANFIFDLRRQKWVLIDP